MIFHHRLLRRSLFAALAAACSTSAGAMVPRIDQLLENAVIPYGPPEIIDLNRDGKPDLVWTSQPSEVNPRGNTVWLRNLGGRSFAPATVLARARLGERALMLKDVDGDSHPELFAVMGPPLTESDAALSTPAFYPMSGEAVSPEVRPLSDIQAQYWMAADLDGQPGTELIASQRQNPELNGFSKTLLTIYSRDTTGGLEAWNTEPMEMPRAVPMRAVSRDVNGDGLLDFEVTPDQGPDTFVFERRPVADGQPVKFVSHTLTIGRFADLDGDGQLDRIAAEGYGECDWQMFSRGPGALQISAIQGHELPVDYHWRILKIEERPGLPALLTFAGDLNSWTEHPEYSPISILKVPFGQWNQAVMTSVSTPVDFTQALIFPHAIADLDGDGFDDLVIEVEEMGDEYVYNLPGYVVAWGKATGFDDGVWITAPSLEVYEAATGDFDGDGDLDLVVSARNHPLPLLMRNDGHGAFPVVEALDGAVPAGGLPAGASARIGAVADMNGDGILDLVMNYRPPSSSYYGPTTQIILLGRGDGTFIPGTVSLDDLESAALAKDFTGQCIDWDGDGDLDLIGFGSWRENLGGHLADGWHSVIGGYQYPEIPGYPLVPETGGFLAGDLDGDGHVDMISLAYSPPGEPLTYTTTTAGFAFADATGQVEQITTAPMKSGDGVANNFSPGSTRIADLNLDGHPDLLTLEITGTASTGDPIYSFRWRKNPGGSSRDVASWPVADLSLEVGAVLAWADYDGDGVKEWCNSKQIIEPTVAGPLVIPVPDFSGGTDFGRYGMETIALGDFDGDGDLDRICCDGNLDLSLVRNQTVDERSGISAALRAQGVLGARSNPDADADGDGRSNAEELLTGSDPLFVDAAPVNWLAPKVILRVDTPYGVVFRTRKDAGELGLSYEMEGSADMKTWTTMSTSGVVWQPVDGGNWQTGIVKFPANSPLRFFRVRYGTKE